MHGFFQKIERKLQNLLCEQLNVQIFIFSRANWVTVTCNYRSQYSAINIHEQKLKNESRPPITIELKLQARIHYLILTTLFRG
jgi:hypothetical protein